MLKSEVDRVIRRCMEETGAEFTEQQIQCLTIAFIKICDRMIEEAQANSSSNNQGRGR